MVRPRRVIQLKDGTYYEYLRKSRKDIEREKYGEMETLARHEADLDELCEREGYPVERKFKEVVSGESIAERKEFQKLMELVEQRKVTGIVVHAVDRLGRGSIDEYGWVIATLQRTRTLVITPGKVYDATNPADYMALVIAMIISEAELTEQKRRYRDGKNRSSKGGEFIGSSPAYGYDKAETEDGQKTLKPNDKAKVVEMIYKSVAAHMLPGTVANLLNKNGVKSAEGKAWHPTVIKRMIRKPVYKGYIKWGETRLEVVDKDGFASKKKQVLQDPEDVICERGLHDAIVSEELWQAANDALGESPRVPAEYELINPLAGLLRCGVVIGPDGEKCGKSVLMRNVTAKSRNRTPRYRHKQYSECDGWRECDADAVIAMVVDSLMQLAGELELRVTFGEEEARKQEEELEMLHSELTSAEYQLDRIIDLYAAKPPAITMEAFRRRSAVLENQMLALRQRIAEVEDMELPDYMELSLNVREVAEALKNPRYSAEKKNAMLKQVVESIEIVNHSQVRGKDDVEIHIFLRK